MTLVLLLDYFSGWWPVSVCQAEFCYVGYFKALVGYDLSKQIVHIYILDFDEIDINNIQVLRNIYIEESFTEIGSNKYMSEFVCVKYLWYFENLRERVLVQKLLVG